MENIDIAQLNSCLPSPIDERDRLVSGEVSLEISRPEVCPAPFDLTNINQFLNVATYYACVGCAGAGLRQTASRLQDVSEDYDYLWNYEQCKMIDGYPNLKGTSLKAMLQVAKETGFKTTGGKLRKIKEYKKIINPNDRSQMETAIFLYHGVLAAVTLSNNGWRGKTVRMPKSGETTGGHAILINGYDNNNYLCQDSMPGYHDGDIFNMPKDYVINEAWAITVDEEIVDADAALTGWIANDVAGTISGNTIIARLNLRDGANGSLIKTLPVGTKFNVLGIIEGKIGGHSWQKIEIVG